MTTRNKLSAVRFVEHEKDPVSLQSSGHPPKGEISADWISWIQRLLWKNRLDSLTRPGRKQTCIKKKA